MMVTENNSEEQPTYLKEIYSNSHKALSTIPRGDFPVSAKGYCTCHKACPDVCFIIAKGCAQVMTDRNPQTEKQVAILGDSDAFRVGLPSSEFPRSLVRCEI